MKIKYLLILHLILSICTPAVSNTEIDSLLQELGQTIIHGDIYIKEKTDRVERMKNNLLDEISPIKKFNIYYSLHSEYRTFQYDSAFKYALKLQESARQLNDLDKITSAKLKLVFTLLSSGMNKEALDSLNTIHPQSMSDSIKVEYYSLMARANYDLSGYAADPYYSYRYVEKGEVYVDSALSLLGENSMQFYALRGMKRATEIEQSKADFQKILDKFNPTLNQYAMAANSLGNIYYHQENIDMAIKMMARAAIADIKASVKEGVALIHLAEFLYHNGNEDRAYEFIKQARSDADFYGARQRKIQVASILPIIEGERLATVEEQRRRLFVFFIAMTGLVVLVVIFSFIIFQQLRQLRIVKRSVTEANDKLQEINDKLIEANRIKEEYIGYSFNIYSEYIEKVEKLKKSIERKLMARKYDEIDHVLSSINLKKDREVLYQNFDKIFIKLFPNFVCTFNSFFKSEDKILLKDQQSLNNELRIFALIRIGINDHEMMARIMEYSVRTIYNYKTKIKNRSLLSNEDFERKIMEIKPF